MSWKYDLEKLYNEIYPVKNYEKHLEILYTKYPVKNLNYEKIKCIDYYTLTKTFKKCKYCNIVVGEKFENLNDHCNECIIKYRLYKTYYKNPYKLSDELLDNILKDIQLLFV